MVEVSGFMFGFFSVIGNFQLLHELSVQKDTQNT